MTVINPPLESILDHLASQPKHKEFAKLWHDLNADVRRAERKERERLRKWRADKRSAFMKRTPKYCYVWHIMRRGRLYDLRNLYRHSIQSGDVLRISGILGDSGLFVVGPTKTTFSPPPRRQLRKELYGVCA